MPFALIVSGKESTVHPLLVKETCGWRCRCGEKVEGLQDALDHVRDQHGGEAAVDPRGDIYNAREVTLEDLQKVGAI